MRVLQLCNKPPLPPVDGGCLAMNSITEGLLNEGVDVTVLSINTNKHPFIKNKVPQEYINQTSFQTAFINTDINPLKAFLNLFTDKAYNVERFYSAEFEKLIIEVLNKKQFDIVQFESLYVLPYLDVVKKHSKAKLVLRAHNIEHKLWERRAAEEKNGLKKTYFNLLASRIKKYENNVTQYLDAIVAITRNDEMYFKHKKSITIPFGINTARYQAENTHTKKGIFFIGALDWQPNIDGLLWFVEKAWSKINNMDSKLYIAGKNTPQKIKSLASQNIIIEGEVPDAITFMNKHNIMVVPLFSGGGMRVKIIEGMALGKTIITTTIGAEGITCTHGENIIIADTPEEFSSQLKKCVNNKNYCDMIGNKAKAFVSNNYDNKILSKKLVEFYKSIVN